MIYQVEAKQVYFVEAESEKDAHLKFIDNDEEAIGFGWTEVTKITEVEDDTGDNQ